MRRRVCDEIGSRANIAKLEVRNNGHHFYYFIAVNNAGKYITGRGKTENELMFALHENRKVYDLEDVERVVITN